LVTQHGAGYNGILWDIMGETGKLRISAVFSGDRPSGDLLSFFDMGCG
jgi:hypothetical protein